ncbi:hypothetical protein FB566_4865 [Stackebrandtia endophytica]|uniref:Serine aminopeptidase S33 domain-containing protein n=1 Tax=Stackebrandtia endophytica TaxID=1496996 RepID=A0A543B372_9ACTN|nr:alpha/beta fold hydrolase [Stackebrandtia endophytica]TQL79264.1 hypothetical protein FB566_4865 [Stackebrandtia endophytica]
MSIRSGIKIVLVIAVVLLLLVALAWMFQRKLIYLPDATAPSEDQRPASAVDVTLHTEDGLRLTAWLVHPTDRDRGMAVLVAPGNAGNRAGRADLGQRLAAEGFTVLLLDYRGYGGNPGSPDETGLRKDALAAWRYLHDEAGFDNGRMIYFGESLGGGAVSHLATVEPPAAMLLRSPFTDLAAAGQRAFPFLPVRALLHDRFPVESDVAASAVPLTVVIGTEDSIIPAQQSRDVATSAEQAGATVTVVEIAADHNDAVLAFGPEVVQAVVDLSIHCGGC